MQPTSFLTHALVVAAMTLASTRATISETAVGLLPADDGAMLIEPPHALDAATPTPFAATFDWGGERWNLTGFEPPAGSRPAPIYCWLRIQRCSTMARQRTPLQLAWLSADLCPRGCCRG